MELSGQKVLIIGLAKSGIGAAKLCAKAGALVFVSDSKTEEALGAQMASLAEEGVEAAGGIFGRAPSDAEAASFDLIVPSPAVPADASYLAYAREHGVRVVSEIELAFWFCKAPIIGITGTNGKTTTTTLIGEILKAWNPQCATAGNIGTAFTGLADSIPEDAMAVLELSSFQLETIESFRPRVSAILNFTPDHLNRHHTYENYVAAKCRIFENQTAEDFCVLNLDDPLVKEKGEALEKAAARGENKPRVIWFSHDIKTKGGVWCENGWIMADMDTGIVPIVRLEELQIIGRHNEENAMAAAACCLRAGIPAAIVRQEMMRFQGVPHRIEKVGVVDGVTYYNDSKGTNPDAAIKGLLAMRSEKTVLIGGGYDKGTPYDDWCKLFPDRVRELVLIGATAQDIEDCAIHYGFPKENIYRAETFAEAVEECRKAAKPGDSVLLSPACASWGMFDNYEQRGDIFRCMVQQMHE